MNKKVFVQPYWLDLIHQASVRFLVLDNSQLNINRGDVLFLHREGADKGVEIWASAEFVTSYMQTAGISIVEISVFETEQAAMSASFCGHSVAEPIYSQQGFQSQEHFDEYRRLSRLIKENTSNKATIAMNERKSEFIKQRNQIPRTKRERA